MQTSRTRITALVSLFAAVALVANLAGCASTAGIAEGTRSQAAGITVQQPALTNDVVDASWN